VRGHEPQCHMRVLNQATKFVSPQPLCDVGNSEVVTASVTLILELRTTPWYIKRLFRDESGRIQTYNPATYHHFLVTSIRIPNKFIDIQGYRISCWATGA
jgi:hypothetical protein